MGIGNGCLLQYQVQLAAPLNLSYVKPQLLEAVPEGTYPYIVDADADTGAVLVCTTESCFRNVRQSYSSVQGRGKGARMPGL